LPGENIEDRQAVLALFLDRFAGCNIANAEDVRTNRNFISRASTAMLERYQIIGIIYADREYQDSFNRAGGLDYRARIRNRWTVTGQAITSNTKNLGNVPQGEQGCEVGTLTCSGQGYQQAVSYGDLHKSWWLSYNDTSAGFVTDTCFLRRALISTVLPSLTWRSVEARTPAQSSMTLRQRVAAPIL
jgi:hypothetical protein